MKQGNPRRMIDIGMTILLLLQMACQVMAEPAHERLGMGMALGYGCGTTSMTRSSGYPEEAYRLGRSL